MSNRIGRPIGVTAVLTLALVCVGGWRVVAYDPKAAPIDATPAGTGRPWTGGAVAAASPAAAPVPTASPSQGSANPDDRYFAGTPALGWADDAAGLAVPAATALNGVSAHDVAAGYALLVRVLAAGNLDATILDGGPATDFTGLLDPRSGLAAKLESWIAHPSRQSDPTVLLTRFDPATTRLVGHTVKVHGTMSATAGPRPDTALLTADYDFVYVVTTPSGGGTGTGIGTGTAGGSGGGGGKWQQRGAAGHRAPDRAARSAQSR
ncbi:MAG TPA: hypothetical protein VH372_18800 [Actinospica sp.]|jgi:hypothetical protein|nr:hypothetical protein [Actinospica sp.]